VARPKDLPPKSSVYDYFDLWTYDGTLEPPVLPGGISGSTGPHSASVRSLGYRNLLRS
jgi:hypothetical protein